jgi:hypothetical protein
MSSELVKTATVAFESLRSVFGVIEVRDKTALTQSEVDALAIELFTAKKVKKEIDEAIDNRVNEVRTVFYRVADVDAGKDEPFTLYSVEHGLKMVRSVTDPPEGIDATVLLDSLYARFGEALGNKDGKAWALWKKVSLPAPRVLSQELLTVELGKAIEQNNGSPLIAAVQAAKTKPARVARFLTPEMTKDEQKAAIAGTL